MKKAIYLGKSTHHTASACLGCGKLLDASLGVGTRSKPRTGAVTVCLDCGHLQAYDGKLQLRPLTETEMVEIAGDERIIAIQKARAAMIKEGKSHG
jgi:hypothetical protein